MTPPTSTVNCCTSTLAPRDADALVSPSVHTLISASKGPPLVLGLNPASAPLTRHGRKADDQGGVTSKLLRRGRAALLWPPLFPCLVGKSAVSRPAAAREGRDRWERRGA